MKMLYIVLEMKSKDIILRYNDFNKITLRKIMIFYILLIYEGLLSNYQLFI